MNNLFLCHGQVGIDICRWLIHHYKDDIGLVVTIGDNQIKESVENAGLNVISVTEKQQVLSGIKAYNRVFDWGFLVWWPWIIETDLIRFPKHGFINTHPSLLPYNRGRHPNFWALVEQSPYGVSLHLVEEGIDCGPIIAQLPISYGWEDNGATLYKAATSAMVDLFRATYPSIREGKFSLTPQDLTKGSFHFANELEKASRIDLDAYYRARDLLNLLRARTFPGHQACYFQDDGHTFEVRVDIRKKHP